MAIRGEMENIENIKVAITVYVPFSLHKEIMRGADPKKREKARRYLSLVQDGFHVQQIKKIASDPEKRADWLKKLGLLVKDVRDEHTLQTMDTGELDNLIFLATQVKESKIKQLLLKYPE